MVDIIVICCPLSVTANLSQYANPAVLSASGSGWLMVHLSKACTWLVVLSLFLAHTPKSSLPITLRMEHPLVQSCGELRDSLAHVFAELVGIE